MRRLRDCGGSCSKPVIVVATCAFAPDEMRAQAAGCDAFLLKACLPDALVSEICRVLALSLGPWAAKRTRTMRASKARLKSEELLKESNGLHGRLRCGK